MGGTDDVGAHWASSERGNADSVEPGQDLAGRVIGLAAVAAPCRGAGDCRLERGHRLGWTRAGGNRVAEQPLRDPSRARSPAGAPPPWPARDAGRSAGGWSSPSCAGSRDHSAGSRACSCADVRVDLSHRRGRSARERRRRSVRGRAQKGGFWLRLQHPPFLPASRARLRRPAEARLVLRYAPGELCR